MNISEILNGLDYTVLSGDKNLEISKIDYDSRKVEEGGMFVAVTGFVSDGHDYIEKAIEKGAKAVVVEREVEMAPGITYIKTNNSRRALAQAAANFYGNPAKKLKMIGVTGTNGKTTSAFMLKGILEKAGHKVGLIGTIANYIGSEKIHTERTTPESLELHELFAEMVEKGVEYCVMEVSSHSLDLDRVYGIRFCEAIFTNLTQDHLDFHKTFENYFHAKSKLFTMSDNSIINVDDKYGRRLLEIADGNIKTYSIDSDSDLRGEDLVLESTGVEFELNKGGGKSHVKIAIPGRYNVYNALGCIGAALNEGVSLKTIIDAISTVTVPGRCENLTIGRGLDFTVIRDYSHTPDSLENILETLRELVKGRIICVFGCGGDRDKTKRPIMGKIGTDLSDYAVITSDNPRTEDPYEILKEVVSGVEKQNYRVVENRREAIKEAMEMAEKGDIVVIAGKGHETYQILKDKTIHFDEKEVVEELIEELKL